MTIKKVYPLLDDCEDYGIAEDVTIATCLEKVNITGIGLDGFYPRQPKTAAEAFTNQREQHEQPIIFHKCTSSHEFYQLDSNFEPLQRNTIANVDDGDAEFR